MKIFTLPVHPPVISNKIVANKSKANAQQLWKASAACFPSLLNARHVHVIYSPKSFCCTLKYKVEYLVDACLVNKNVDSGKCCHNGDKVSV